MKSRDGKIQRREEKKKEDQKRESFRRKRIQVREKSGKSRNTVFFPMICGSGGSKSRHYLWGRSIFPNQTAFDATNKKAGNFKIIREVDNLMDSG